MAFIKLKSFMAQCARVWQLLRKPTADEFKKTAIIAAIGLAILGVLGFAISLAMRFVFPE